MKPIGVPVPEFKDTNPKDAVGTAKVPFSTVSAPVFAEVGLAMMEGALKYGRHNYRAAGVRGSVYYDAALRHLAAFWEGQDIDPDSGLPHVVKAIACLAVLRDGQIQANWVDDRPPVTPGDWVQELNAKAKVLLEKYPNPLPAHTAIEQMRPVPVKILGFNERDRVWRRAEDDRLWRYHAQMGYWQTRSAKFPEWHTSLYQNGDIPEREGPFFVVDQP